MFITELNSSGHLVESLLLCTLRREKGERSSVSAA